MSRYRYNKQNRCGACYEFGHNKRSCPRKTEQLVRRLGQFKETIARRAESGNNTEYYEGEAKALGEKIAQRTKSKVNAYDGTIMTTTQSTTRQCSYCRAKDQWDEKVGRGHTRRTCQALKDDLAQAQKDNAIYRAGILAGMREAGVGLGSLLKSTQYDYWGPTNEYRQDSGLYLVHQVAWDEINYLTTTARVIHMKRMDRLGAGLANDCEIGLPGCLKPIGEDGAMRWVTFDRNSEEKWVDAEKSYRFRFWPANGVNADGNSHGRRFGKNPTMCASPVPAETINPPAGWLAGASSEIEEHFKNLKAKPKKASDY